MMKRARWVTLVCGWMMLVGACGGNTDEAPSVTPQDVAEVPSAPLPPDPPASEPAPPVPPTAEAQPGPDEQPVSHCRSDETAVFSCRLDDSEKVVSICASDDLARDGGYLQYRFGRIGAVELTFPEDRQNTQEHFRWQTIGYSGGWDTRVQFSNGGYTYQLYDQAFKVSISEKSLHGGIIIRDGEAVIAHLHCNAATLGTPYTNSLNDLFEKIPQGTFFDDES